MHARVSATQQEARVNALQQEADRLQQELGIGEDAAKIVDNHIKLLHRYNEIKDATQMLIGRVSPNSTPCLRALGIAEKVFSWRTSRK
ncbi:hypothetical protein E1B28_007730 [Marasmius oreades]|uniref:Uncharacterized protein n=1 Tax=Marasmius oreades TaxID=181124 RepID=A0A9P7S2S9_9AGAR|nr:uncharacterized protein E1B28_007730 [Marasmius oreades]KAG7094118.1 hypothetical protein E1B28_007730 [Marasmius oreades]